MSVTNQKYISDEIVRPCKLIAGSACCRSVQSLVLPVKFYYIRVKFLSYVVWMWSFVTHSEVKHTLNNVQLVVYVVNRTLIHIEQISWKSWNVLEKDGEDELDRSREKWRNVTQSQGRKNILHKTKRRKADCVGHICLGTAFKNVIGVKTAGTRRHWRKRKNYWMTFRKRGCGNLKEEAPEHTPGRTRFWKAVDLSQETRQWMNMLNLLYKIILSHHNTSGLVLCWFASYFSLPLWSSRPPCVFIGTPPRHCGLRSSLLLGDCREPSTNSSNRNHPSHETRLWDSTMPYTCLLHYPVIAVRGGSFWHPDMRDSIFFVTSQR
jgi:hypothetical protein